MAEYNWDSYVQEAAAPDFVLKTGDEEIRVTNPTGVQVMRMAQGVRSGDLDAILLALTGESYPQIRTLVNQAGFKALPKLIEDLMAHFDMHEDVELVGPNGDRVTEKSPTKIRLLLKKGYQPGE